MAFNRAMCARLRCFLRTPGRGSHRAHEVRMTGVITAAEMSER